MKNKKNHSNTKIKKDNYILKVGSKIKAAIILFQRNRSNFTVVLDKNKNFLGVLTFSDIKKALIKPTLIYSDIIKKISMTVRLISMSHITGGGITENLPRVIPDNLTAKVIRNSWIMPKIFKIIQFGNIFKI